MRHGLSYSEAGKLGAQKTNQIQEASRLQRIEQYNINPTRCKNCDNSLLYEKRNSTFCNRSCSISFNNKGVRRHGLARFCANCETKINNPKYCNITCKNDFEYKSYISRWLNGLENGVVADGLSVSNYIHRWIREQLGEQCHECSWCKVHPKTGIVPLQMDHLDGNSLNNRPDNLRLLCGSCHSLTDTYGGLNKGNGRVARYNKPS